MKPTGHNYRVSRARVEDGWQLAATCRCGHRVTADHHDDLHALINDHYDDMRRQALEEQHA